MSEKEKPKRSPGMGFLRSCLIFSLYPLLILTVFGISFTYWAIGGYVKPSLDPQYLPTAEYLLENPFEDPKWKPNNIDGLYTDIEPNPLVNGSVCIHVSSSHFVDFSNLRWVEVYINEQVVSRIYFGSMNILPTEPYHGHVCYRGYLESGLHTIEFRAKENLFAEPYYIHRWAIEIP